MLSSLEQFSNFEANTLITFGVLLLAGVFGGMAANRIAWMPTITAFMLVGVVFGPHGLNLLTQEMLNGSSMLVDIALGLILYKLGNMLHPNVLLKSHKTTLTSLAESSLTFFSTFAIVYLWGMGPIAAAFIGAIAISSSPAVLVHVAEELEASGPVTERAKLLVAINNLLSFIIFMMVLPFALSKGEASFGSVVIVPFYHLLFALSLGVSISFAAVQVAKMLKPHDEHYRFAVMIGAVMLTLGLSKMLSTPPLFSTLVLGIATRRFEKKRNKLSHVPLGEGGDLFLIILFVVAGAKLDVRDLAVAGVLPLLLFISRCLSKLAGVYALHPMTNHTPRDALALSLLLVPMAGMAIGLATTLQGVAPEIGGKLSAVVFAMVALFETIGPFAAVKAFTLADEVGDIDGEEKKPQ